MQLSMVETPHNLAVILARALGGPGSGHHGHSGGVGGPGNPGGSVEGRGGDEKPRSEISQRALKHAKPNNALTQRFAEANEAQLHKMVGGINTPGNAAMDVIMKFDGKLAGFELKTMINQKNDKITVRTGARIRKETWAKESKATLHTVMFDDRKRFAPELYSGHRIYYHRGVGSFRLSTFVPVQNSAHLRKLMRER